MFELMRMIQELKQKVDQQVTSNWVRKQFLKGIVHTKSSYFEFFQEQIIIFTKSVDTTSLNDSCINQVSTHCFNNEGDIINVYQLKFKSSPHTKLKKPMDYFNDKCVVLVIWSWKIPHSLLN